MKICRKCIRFREYTLLKVLNEILDIMKGMIGVKSETGVGSIFWVQILFANVGGLDSKDMDEKRFIINSAKSQKHHLLVVEDDPVSQAVITGMLTTLGYNADVVVNGKDALERIKQFSYDLIFMDCLMPDMDGLEATGCIREFERSIDPNKQAIIIALTAKAMKGDREQCIAAGMDDYMCKPVDLDELQMILEKYLD